MYNIRNLFPAFTLFALTGICSASSVVNGGFETGTFSGWNQSVPSTYADPFWTGVRSVFALGGANAAHFGSYSDDPDLYITQTLDTTPGAHYTISFSYGEYNQQDPYGPFGYLNPANIGNTDYSQGNKMVVLWNGVQVFGDTNFFTSDQNITTQGHGFWNQETITVQATGAFSNLSFAAFDQQQDVVLDNVSVFAPEPATLGLIGSALAGLGLLRRKRASGRSLIV